MRKSIKFILLIGFAVASCSKDTASAKNLYTPVASDATAKATLAELQQGRDLYISKCGDCHGLYPPDDYSTSRWSSIMSQMVPNTNLNSSQADLVRKYLTRGK